jgi:hypothetical protein
METPTVTVLVSPELIKELDEWSQPVEVKIVKNDASPTGYEMIARRVHVQLTLVREGEE